MIPGLGGAEVSMTIAVGSSAPGQAFRNTDRFVAGAALGVTSLGVAVMVGWLLELDLLRQIAPRLSTMKFNTALCFALAGGALYLGRGDPGLRSAAGCLSLLVLGLSGATLAQYPTGADLGIDQLLMKDPGLDLATPGRMSVITAVGFVLFSALLLLRLGTAGGGRIGHVIGCTVGLTIAALALVGYLYGVRLLYQPVPSTSIAVHTAAGLLVLFAAELLTRPQDGWVGLFFRGDSVGSSARTILPLLFLLPVLFGWVGILGMGADMYGAHTLVAWVVVATVLIVGGGAVLAFRRAAGLNDELRRQQLALSTMLENSLDALVVVGAGGTVLQWNTEAERVFGRLRGEAVGASLTDLIVPPGAESSLSSLIASLTPDAYGRVAGRRQVVEALDAEGRVFPMDVTAVPVSDDERGWVYYCFGRDLSEQRALEDQLRQAQKMEAVGQLTGGIAHDFNNLLTVVIGSIDLLAARLRDGDRALAEQALRSAESGATLVHRLLAFSRRQTLAPQPIDVNALVQGMHDLLSRTLGERIDIRTVAEPGAWHVLADPGQLENALLNMAVNARDAMEGAGVLTIETGNVHLDARYAAENTEVTPGDYGLLAVTDTGCGMPPEVIERAFDPFFTTKKAGMGTGLGLSMIYGFAKQSGGHLKIYSEVGEGTTIRLYLPKTSDGADVAAPRPGRAALGGRGEAILVVEDDADVRGFVAAVLQDLGYTLHLAATADEALDVLRSDARIDLLFTDVVIPGGLSGREIAEAAQAERPGLRVLYTSGYTENSIVHQGRLDAGVAFLAKPYKRDELGAAVAGLLGAASGLPD